MDPISRAPGGTNRKPLAALPASGSPDTLQRSSEPLSFIVQSSDLAVRARLQQAMAASPGGAAVTEDLKLIDAVAVRVPAAHAEAFARLMGSFANVHVYPDGSVHIPESAVDERQDAVPFLDVATKSLGADKLWAQGITGKGVSIAVIDTGIAPHPDLGNKIVAFHDFVGGRTQPYDDEGHGTHVSSIAAGTGKASGGKYSGFAPGASLVGLKVLDSRGNGSASNVIAAIQWAVQNKDKYGIRVINLSLGAPSDSSYKNEPICQAIAAAHAAGIICCVAAGNDGPWSRTVDSPGDSPDALTVGAADDQHTVVQDDDRIPFFSSRGPTPHDGLHKPDLVAPGVNITAARANTNGYRVLSGTSMATPCVAGIAALLLQVKPTANPDEVRDSLTQTATQVKNWLGRPYGRDTQGAGMANPVAAAKVLKP